MPVTSSSAQPGFNNELKVDTQDLVLLRQLGEGLEAGLGGHQASDSLEMAFQLGVQSRELDLRGQEGQDSVVDQLFFVLRK